MQKVDRIQHVIDKRIKCGSFNWHPWFEMKTEKELIKFLTRVCVVNERTGKLKKWGKVRPLWDSPNEFYNQQPKR